MALTGTLFRLFYEWAAKGKSYEDFLGKLDKNETTVHGRIINATDNSWNRERAVHVIGIERWGTQRLRVLLGAPLVIDEYDGYAPSNQLNMIELAREFTQTRAATVAVVRELQSRGIALSQTVKHNEVGDLTVGGWIFYLENHIGRETHLLMQGNKNKAKQITQA